MKTRLNDLYKEKIIKNLMGKFEYKNVHQVPKLEKIVINMRIGDASNDKSFLESAMTELSKITGQKPVITRAKKAVSNFGIRKGNPVGCKVTLRKERMYEFLDRLVNITLPRIRDFRGVKTTSFDKQGNYSLGLSEQTMFPELDYDEIKRTQGMDIVFTIDSDSKEASFQLLKEFGMPFKKGKV